MPRCSTLSALAATLVIAGCRPHASPAPHAEQAPSTGSPAPGAAAPHATASAAEGAALAVHVEELTPPMPGAVPSKLELRADKSGLVLEMIEGLACDGHWVWRARRTGPGSVTLRLSDENHSSMRSSCARMVHQRLRVPGLQPGSYQVHVAMPTGYGSLDRSVTIAP